MKKLALLLIPILFCSCNVQEKQIDDIAFVKIIGIDTAQSGVKITISLQPTKKDEEEKTTYSIESDTIAHGLYLLEARSERRIFYGQVEIIALSEELAKNGILDAVNYLVRSSDFRFDLPIVIIKDSKCDEFIENASQKGELYKILSELFLSSDRTSVSGKTELSRLAEMIENPFESPYLPYVMLSEEEPVLGGYCIFNGEKLVKFLDNDDSFGINLLNNNVRETAFVVKTNNYEFTVSLRDCDVKTKYENGIFKINVKFCTEVLQADKEASDFSRELRSEIIEQQNREIQDRANKTIALLQEQKCDCSGFGKAFYRYANKEAQKISGNWLEIFPYITYEINIESEISRSVALGKVIKSREK